MRPAHAPILVLLAAAVSGALGQSPYTEEAQVRGARLSLNTFFGFGAGAAFADFTGDGRPDLFVPGGFGQPIHFLVNDGAGSFLDRTAQSQLGPSGNAKGVAVADVDGDGDLDAYVTRISALNSLFLNDGAGVFSDVAAAAGTSLGRIAYGAAFLDADRDDDLDLAVGVYGYGLGTAADRNALFIDGGAGVYTEEAAARGVDNAGLTFMVLAFDHDRDGGSDLFVANDRGNLPTLVPDTLYRNLGSGWFADVSLATGTAFGINAMGADAADIDGDLDFDVHVTNTGAGHLLHVFQAATGTYTEEAAARGAIVNRLGWANVFHDRDNDGDVDLFLAHQGPVPPGSNAADNSLLVNDGTGHFTDQAPVLGLNSGESSFGACVADLEGDGDLDLFLPDPPPAFTKLYVNPGVAGNGHLAVVVRARGRNGRGIGARVTVTAAGRTQVREIRSSQGYLSASEPVAHFGLGAATVVDRVEVRFPSGATAVRTGVAAGATITIAEPDVAAAGPFAAGASTAFTLSVPGDGGRPYLVLASLAATPRLPLPDGRVLGVGWDGLAAFFLQGAPTVGSGTIGTLGPTGTAAFALAVPAMPSLSGGALRIGALTLDPLAPSGIRSHDGGRVQVIN